MKALLLVAHGSRRSLSNEEVAEQTARLRSRLVDEAQEQGEAAGGFEQVTHAFLELAEPDIPAGIEALVAAGASDIVVLPYFLAAGTHVSGDIPAIIAASRASHGHVRIRLTEHLGASAVLLDALAGIARSVQPFQGLPERDHATDDDQRRRPDAFADNDSG